MIQDLTNAPNGLTMFMNWDRGSYYDDVLCFNMQQLINMNVTNKEAFSLVMTHECCHRVIQNTQFPGVANGQWESELCPDFFMGCRAGLWNIGVQTKTAVQKFQKNCGITVDGIAGPKTLKYLGITQTSASSGGKYSSNDVTLLAKLIAAEARGESYTGQVAVGAVVLNRVKHSSFPDTVSGVIYQKGAFSAVNDKNWSVAPNETSRKAAQDCVNGWDPSGGAIYYYNPKKTTNSFMLSRPVVKTIGNHVFCK